MRSNSFKSPLVRSALAASVLLLASGASFAQTAAQPINLTAAPTTDTLPDGSVVPMWGYSCGTAVALSTATCKALNPAVAGAAAGSALAASWSPVVITIPYTTGTVNGVAGSTTTLTINLANHLTFTPMTPAGAAANSIPTSLTIVGQLGGGLGTPGTGCTGGATCTTSPTHASQVVTWSTVGSSPAFTPPSQGPRVQSFGTEVAATASTATTTTPLCFGNCTATQPGLKPGTYLIESGTHPSIQGPMGLYGILVVTTAPTATAAGIAYPAYTTPTAGTVAGVAVPAVTYNAEVPVLFGEIDPVQNTSVNAAVSTAGFNELNVWSGQPGMCGNPLNANGSQNTTTYNTCYPPAVNYTPLYYTVNGVGFDRTHATNSLFPVTQGTAPGQGGRDRQRAGAHGQCRIAHARAFDRWLADDPDGVDDNADGYVDGGARILADLRGRQPAAGRPPRAERRVHGRGQDLRRDDQCAGRRIERASGLRPGVELVGQRDRTRRRHAGLYRRQWRRRAGRRFDHRTHCRRCQGGHVRLPDPLHGGSLRPRGRVRSGQGRDRQ